MGESDQLKLMGGGCCCCGSLVLIIILFAISFPTLDTGTYAFKFSHWSQGPDGELMTEPGIKHVGPLNGLIRYPSVQQTVYFENFPDWDPDSTNEVLRPPVKSRTNDGLEVSVKVSFQWQLEAGSLRNLYDVLGGAEDLLTGERVETKPSFIGLIIRLARGSLTQVCSEYTAGQFFANQSAVEVAMKMRLSETFNQPEKKLNIAIKDVQLRSVDLPDKYEDAIARTQAEEQAYETAKAARETQKTQKETEVMLATKKQEQLMLEAEAQADKTRQENQAWIDQYTKFQQDQATAYASILAELGSTTGNKFDVLLELMSQKALKEHDQSKSTLTM